MNALKKELQTVVKDLRALTLKTEKIAKQLDKLKKTRAVKEPKPKVMVKATKKRVARKATRLTAIDTVLKIINRSSKGLDTASLRKKTGFEGRKIRDFVYNLKKQGKIKRDRNGFYKRA